jgi:hypothetical protein
VGKKTYLILLLIGLLAACGGPATPEVGDPSSIPTAEISPTPAAPLVILVIPADMPASEYDSYQTLIYELAQQNGMRFQVLNSLSLEELQAELPALKIVICLAPTVDLPAMAAAAPTVQFLAVDLPGVTAGANLSTIGGNDQPVDKQAFLAGYIAALIAWEWRTGVLSERDTPEGEAARMAFSNGYHYFCGTCRNALFSSPRPDYPIVVRIPTDAPESEYIYYAAALLDYNQNFYADVVYVFPDVATDDVYSYLAEENVLLLGQEMPGEHLRENWVASIQPNVVPAIQDIFSDLLAGSGGQTIATPLYLTEVNETLLGDGKLRDAQAVLDGLLNGTIGTGVTP